MPRQTVYLPSIYNESGIGGQNDIAYALFEIAVNDPGQQRKDMHWNDKLARVAQAYAERMAREGFFSHTDPQGKGANWRVRQGGYRLPDWYGTALHANNVESLSGGHTTAESAWNGWLRSPDHRIHVLGEISIYAEQSQVGVGHFELKGSRYRHYWVFLSAHPEPSA